MSKKTMKLNIRKFRENYGHYKRQHQSPTNTPTRNTVHSPPTIPTRNSPITATSHRTTRSKTKENNIIGSTSLPNPLKWRQQQKFKYQAAAATLATLATVSQNLPNPNIVCPPAKTPTNRYFSHPGRLNINSTAQCTRFKVTDENNMNFHRNSLLDYLKLGLN